MTREQFIDSICDFYELSTFCEECSCTNDAFEYICGYDIDQRICEDIRNATDGRYWNQIRDALDDIEELDGYEWYRRNGELDYSPALDFEDEKNRVLEYVDEYDDWDEEDPEEWDEENGSENALRSERSEAECDMVLGDLSSFARILGI